MRSIVMATLTGILTLSLCMPVGAEPKLTPLEHLIYTKCRIEFCKARALEKARYYAPMIARIARAHKLPSSIVAAIIWHESNYHRFERSHCGAVGLMQVIPMPGRFKSWQDPMNPETNINEGCKLLRYYLTRCHGDWRKALTAYNYGLDAVYRGRSQSPYALAVLRTSSLVEDD